MTLSHFCQHLQLRSEMRNKICEHKAISRPKPSQHNTSHSIAEQPDPLTDQHLSEYQYLPTVIKPFNNSFIKCIFKNVQIIVQNPEQNNNFLHFGG